MRTTETQKRPQERLPSIYIVNLNTFRSSVCSLRVVVSEQLHTYMVKVLETAFNFET